MKNITHVNISFVYEDGPHKHTYMVGRRVTFGRIAKSLRDRWNIDHWIRLVHNEQLLGDDETPEEHYMMTGKSAVVVHVHPKRKYLWYQ